jgi:hypothetical protein
VSSSAPHPMKRGPPDPQTITHASGGIADAKAYAARVSEVAVSGRRAMRDWSVATHRRHGSLVNSPATRRQPDACNHAGSR